MSINKCFAVVAGMLAALWCGSAAADVQIGPGGGITTNTGLFSVSEPTTYTHTTNIYLHSSGYGAIDANLTLKDRSYVRLVGRTSAAPERGLYIATNANADLTINITGKSALFALYRNSTTPANWAATGVDPYNKDAQYGYIHVRLGIGGGAKDSCGRATILNDTTPSFGDNSCISFWSRYLHIESSAKAHDSGYIDFLKLSGNGIVDICQIIQNNTYYPARIIFDGGCLRANQTMADTTLPFQPAANTVLVAEGINGNDIVIKKCYPSIRKPLNGGAGVLRFQGDCDVVLDESGAALPKTSGQNCYPFHLDPTKGPIEWNQSGDIVLTDNAILEMGADNQLPLDTCLRMRGDKRPILDVSGHTVSLRSLISENSKSMVSNVMANVEGQSVESRIVFGTNDTHGVFSAKCYDYVNIEKVGAGTLIISNATVDVNNTGTASVNIKEGTVIFIGTNKIGNEDMLSSSRCTIADGVTVVKNPTSWGVGKELILGSGGYLKLGKDNQLPNGVTNQEIRLTGNAVLDLNGHNLKVPVLVAANTASVTNGTSTLSTLYFGEDDYADSRLSAKCFGNISMVKNGSGTMSIMDATVDSDNTGNGSVTINSGSVVFYGTNKIGDATMQSSARCTFGEGVEKLDGVVVEVANGVTQISDETYTDGTLRLRVFKRGAGTLVLTNALNDFSGGLVIDEGIVKVTAVGAQGTSNIIVNCDATVNREAQIKFATCPPNDSTKMIYTNDIYVTGSSAFTYVSSYNEKGAICFAQTNQVLQGSITAAADLSIVDSKDGALNQDAGKMQNNVGGIVKGPVTVNGDLHFNSGYKSYFYGPVTANTWWNRARDGCRGAIYLCSTNMVGTYKTECYANCKIYSNCNDSLKGSKLEWTREGNGAHMRGSVHIGNANGETEVVSISGVDSCRNTEVIGNSINGYAMMGFSEAKTPTKLTIVGEENAAAKFCGIVGVQALNQFTLHLNAPDSYTQIFSNVYYVADGELKVSSGTLIIDGKSYFPNLKTITVAGDGVLDIRGLGSVTNDSINCIPALTTLNVASSAKLKLAEGIAITSTVVKVDGYQLNADTYSKYYAHDLAWLEGDGSITATKSPTSWTSEDAVWSGNGGSDTSVGTADNWETSPAPVFYYGRYRPVFGEGGSEAVFAAEANYLGGIKFSRDADFTVRCEQALRLGAGIEIAGTGHVYTIDAPVVQSVASTLKLTTDTKLVFNHTYEVAGNLTFGMTDSKAKNAEVYFTEPLIASGNIAGDSGSKGASPYLMVKFAATGNKGNSLNLGYMNVHFLVDNAFDNTPFSISGGENESPVNFHNTRQQTPTFSISEDNNGKGQLSGEYPATLAITNGWTDRATAVSKKFGSGHIAGWLKLEKSGPGYQILGATTGAERTYDSYGDIEVSGGTLEILPNATWLNGTNIIVKGTGQLILADPAKAQIGPQAVFHFGNDAGDTESKLVVTNGLTYQVEAIYLGDTQLPAGVYDGSSEQLSGRITGGGKLRVKHGTMFIFR